MWSKIKEWWRLHHMEKLAKEFAYRLPNPTPSQKELYDALIIEIVKTKAKKYKTLINNA